MSGFRGYRSTVESFFEFAVGDLVILAVYFVLQGIDEALRAVI